MRFLYNLYTRNAFQKTLTKLNHCERKGLGTNYHTCQVSLEESVNSGNLVGFLK